jgi:aspartokinase/homoserine dehydrogenase 1
MRVLKFGGSSVASSENIKKVLNIIIETQKKHSKIAVVVSAFGGVTDKLLQLKQHALNNQDAYQLLFSEINNLHCGVVKNLITAKKQPHILSNVKELLNQLDDVCRGIALVNECSIKTIDFIASFGERLSAYIISEVLKENLTNAEFLDARKLVKTDSSFCKAKVDFNKTNLLIAEYFTNNNHLQVITGFIGSDEHGFTTTLGRSGSDYTAAIFGAALNADVIEIWTDVDGIMTADPREVKDAFSLASMTYEEAMEISHFGAKVIFPATMLPAMSKKIPLLIKNTFNPSFKGTIISDVKEKENLPIKGISSLAKICLLNIKGSNMLGIIGVSQRLFSSLAQADINIILISQASSEHSICLAVEEEFSQKAKLAIEQMFETEIKRQWIDLVEVISDLAIIAIVGENMHNVPGISGKLFGTLGKNGINVMAIAQGSSELNISVVIHKKHLSKALNALHESFFLSNRKHINLFMVGTGLIGNELLAIIDRQQSYLNEQHHLQISIHALSNSKKMLLDEDKYNYNNYKEQMETSQYSADLSCLIEHMKQKNLPNSIFVDATSSEEIVKHYSDILSSNISIVTPNKKANSGPIAHYKKLQTLSKKHNIHFKYETNVAAGLPVISVIKDLLNSGDSIKSIEAVLSGSINYLLSEYNGEKPFSELVKDTMQKGYSEPDPRDDLNGMDVARKILILARECACDFELRDVQLESIVPQKYLDAKSKELFLEQLKLYDKVFHQLYENALSKEKKLRYISCFKENKITVRLEEVSHEHPFYSLKGTENCVCLTTTHYHTYPMIIKGPGAGAAVTAAGVLAEIIRIINN